MEPARRVRHVHQLHLPLPHARGLRGRRGIAAGSGADAGRAAHDRPSSPGHLRGTGSAVPGRQRGHHRARRGCAARRHGRQLGGHAAGEPARPVGPGGGPGQPGRAEAQGPRGAGRARPRRALLTRRVRVRRLRGRMGGRGGGNPRGRRRYVPAGRRGLRGGPGRGLRAAVVRADGAARSPPAPPCDRPRLHDGRGRFRAAEAAAGRLSAGRRDEESLRGVRYAHRAAAVDQPHGEADALLRLVDGDGTHPQAHRGHRRAGERRARTRGVRTRGSRTRRGEPARRQSGFRADTGSEPDAGS